MMRFLQAILLVIIFAAQAQGQGYVVNITGTTTVNTTSTYTYNVVWTFNGSPSSAPSGGTYSWQALSGTAHSSGSTYAAIQWAGSGTAIFQYIVSGTTYTATINVTNSSCAATPSVVFSPASSTCSPRALSYTGTPPGGIIWYWQTSATGTSTSNSTNTYNVTTTGTYYVRPYNTTTSCWGANSASYNMSTITAGPATPGTPTVGTETCGSKSLTHGTPPANVTWYWQGTNASGTSTSNSGTDLASSSGTYFLRARDNSTSCWSANSSSAPVTINDPSVPATPTTTTNSCGPQTLSKVGSAPANVTWYWQGTNSGGTDYISTAAIGTTYTATVSGTYYLRARSSSGCWSATAASVSVTVLAPPAVPGGIATTQQTTTSFKANWTAVSGADDYVIEIASTTSFLPVLNTFTTTGTFFLVSGLTEGNTYYFRIQSRKQCSTSASSSYGTAVLIPPPPVATLATSITTGSFNINWQPANGATGYYFDLSTSNTFFPSTTLVYNNASTSSFDGFTGNPNGSIFVYNNITTLTATYYYRIRAVNSSGTSISSNIITVMQFPATPVATAATDYTKTSFKANWNAVPAATEYRLDVSKSKTFQTMIAGYDDRPVTGTDITLLGLGEGVVYYYRVRAKNVSGTSISSNVIKAVTWKDHNYIVATDVMKPGLFTESDVANVGTGIKLAKYDYFNGVGRLEQSVRQQASPLAKDVVQPIAYDQFGRSVMKYLPYVSTSVNAAFQQTAINDQLLFYANGSGDKIQDDIAPYAEARLEASPLDRMVKQGAPGEAWQPNNTNSYASNDKTMKMAYETNLANEVLSWTYAAPTVTYPFGLVNATLTAAPTTPVYYGPGKLFKSKTKDEHLNEVIEYKTGEGRVVLKRVQLTPGSPSTTDASKDTNYASTYYVYNDFGDLVCVLPPESVNLITKGTSEYFGKIDSDKEDFLKRWAFRYAYDSRKRLIQKQVPGAGAVYLVYDKRDRLVLTQDANQRAGATNAIKYWTFTKYDEMNRPIATGIKDTTTTVELTQIEMQGVVDTFYGLMSTTKPWRKWGETYVGTASGNVHLYSNKSYPVSTSAATVEPLKYLTVTYYDDYSFRSNLTPNNYSYVNESLVETVSGAPYNQPMTYNQPISENMSVRGLVTGTKTKVLDGGTVGGSIWLNSVAYYDDQYRSIQTIADNYKGGYSRTTTLYDFVGKELKTKTTDIRGVSWTDLVGASAVFNTATRNIGGSGWGASGAASAQFLPAGQDGWVEFTATAANTYRMLGLSEVNKDANVGTMNYAIYVRADQTLYAYEGATATQITGGYVAGDKFRIQRVGTTVKFYKNNSPTPFFIGVNPSTTSLVVDAAFYAIGASLNNVITSFSGSVIRRMVYDHAGRLIETYHQIEGQPNEVLIAKNEYNELGQLVDKKLHSVNGSTAKQAVDYRYNIRGWMTRINDAALTLDGSEPKDFFGMELGYDAPIGVGNASLYNGNISGMTWSRNLGLGSIKQTGYVFDYDAMNRLLSATHKHMTAPATWGAGQYDEGSLTYDLNGNIKALQRRGEGGVQIDDLTYNYGTGATASNKLLYVQDNTLDGTNKLKGFIDGNTGTSPEYTYDVNGNMTRDLNKGIGASISDPTNRIVYNFLNLPETVTKSGNVVKYVYDAGGRKLSQIVTMGTTKKQTDYDGEFTYENDVLQFINHNQGRIVVANTKLIYKNSFDVYNATDMTRVNSNGQTYSSNGEEYVKVTSSSTASGDGLTEIGGTYNVIAGDRYRVRVKGYRATTNAVYLQVKAGTTLLNSTGASLPGSMATESWIEQIVLIPFGNTTMTVGLVWGATGTNDVFYLNELEITKLESIAPEYQYNLNDHLGNARLTFTSKDETESVTATFESANMNAEQAKFTRYANARRVKYYAFDHTNGSAPLTTDGYAQRLNGKGDEIYGVARSISVMPGDVINMEVYAKYVEKNLNDPQFAAFAGMIAQIASTTPPGSLVFDGAGYNGSTAAFPFDDESAENNGSSTEPGPKAFLNWLVFDRDYNLIASKSSYKRMSWIAGEHGQDVNHEKLGGTVTIDEPGYIYIFPSNEEGANAYEVYFDDLKVEHIKSPVIQMNDYYPFGLSFNHFARENSVLNNYLFNRGSELQTGLDFGFYFTLFRTYDPSLGRFMQMDPLADFFSGVTPYSFAFDNPVLYSDPDGLAPLWWLLLRVNAKQLWYNATGRANKHAQIKIHSKSKVTTIGATLGRWRTTTHGPTSSTQSTTTPKDKDDPLLNMGDLKLKMPDLEISNYIPEPSRPDPSYKGTLIKERHSFTESISFVTNSDHIEDTPENDKIINDLLKALQDFPQLKLVIKGNAGTDRKYKDVHYGNGDDALNDDATLNGTKTNVRGLMTARAKAIYDALIKSGIDKDRLKYEPGTKSPSIKGRSTTFEFADE